MTDIVRVTAARPRQQIAHETARARIGDQLETMRSQYTGTPEIFLLALMNYAADTARAHNWSKTARAEAELYFRGAFSNHEGSEGP